jgi:superfamily II DNA/RNA helicase
VFNFDTPWHPDDYVHRIGRTGRAGAKGRAFTLVTPEDAEAIANVEKLTGLDIPLFDLGGGEEKEEARPPSKERPAREERREKAPPREKSPPREKKPEKRPAKAESERREPEDEPSAPGEWNGPVPGFLRESAL